MRRYENLVVTAALDDRDTTTMEHAAHFARAAGSKKVCIAHVLPESEMPRDLARKYPSIKDPTPETLLEKLKERLGPRAKALGEGTSVEYSVRQGAPPLEIAKIAVETEADLVIFSRFTGSDPDPLGDLALRVLRSSPCSTAIIPAGARPSYEKILVCVDFSSYSLETLDVAFAVASTAEHPSVTILHVYSVPNEPRSKGKAGSSVATAARKLAEKQWSEIRDSVNTRGVPWSTRFEPSADVPRTIVSVADELNVNLILMSSRGRAQDSPALLGHVPEIVCTHTTRPFFCVKKRGEVVGLLKSLLQFLSIKKKS